MLAGALASWNKSPEIERLREAMAGVLTELVCIELEVVLARRNRHQLREQLLAVIAELSR